MIASLGVYRTNIPFIRAIYDKDENKTELIKLIGEMSIATGVPIIVVAHYVNEFNHSEEILQFIERLKLFYGYKEIRE